MSYKPMSSLTDEEMEERRAAVRRIYCPNRDSLVFVPYNDPVEDRGYREQLALERADDEQERYYR